MLFEVAAACILTLLFYFTLKRTVGRWYEAYMRDDREEREQKDAFGTENRSNEEQDKEQGGKR